ncbi:hypothetical protein DM02DRAFT_615259 [Periconia macrospinosa]|uniref:CCD97-like C-terminal domain-containing protein n=1 Tax=Periconia macrospinosa TaxID=97972 RepID=A0A2V1DMT4_9PLEO|nr:hypothetical protein DM02DRAFT_615259 [Periconia macrospinosa]
MPFLKSSPDMLTLAVRTVHMEANSPATEDTRCITPNNPNRGADLVEETNDSTVQDLVMLEDAGVARSHAEERSRWLKAKNRRKRYLEVHPDYFDDSSLELADPLLYDRLIRRFQTTGEREAEGLRKGFAGDLTAQLWRAEAKKHALSHPDPHSLFSYTRGPGGEIRAEDKDEVPMTKEEGREWWVDEMTQRFLRGDDMDFDYSKVDTNDEYNDPEEERDIQDAYFDSMDSDFDSDGEGKEKVLTGETGIQDF